MEAGFLHYLFFMLEVITIVVAILVVFAGLMAISMRNKLKGQGELVIKPLHTQYRQIKQKMQQEVMSKAVLKKIRKQDKQQVKQDKKNNRKQANSYQKKMFVIRFNGDVQASSVEQLRREVSGILAIASIHDEVVVCLESPGGVVHGYGLAASQLDRIRQRHIPLTVIVDKVAASGGYMMACVADKIIAAPFAIIGSVGVIAQLPNFHRWLEKNAIDFEQHTAGEFKRTLTLFGKNTPAARKKFKQDLEQIHGLFKQFVATHRQQVVIDEVATGEHWLGTQALTLKLVDELSTSDDYLLKAYDEKTELFDVCYHKKTSLVDRLSHKARVTAENLLIKPISRFF